MQIREREKPRRGDTGCCARSGKGREGATGTLARDAEGRELGSSRLPRPEPSREAETYGYFPRRGPESRGSPRSAGLPLPRPPASRAERVTSGPLRAPPTRRQRLREAGGCALEARGKRCASPTRPASSHWAGAPHLLPLRAAALGVGRRGRWRLPPPLGQVQRMVVSRARAAAEADLPLLGVGLGCRQHRELTAAHSRQLRRRHGVARTGTNGGTPQTDPEAFQRQT